MQSLTSYGPGALVSGAATGCTSAGRVRQGHLIDLHQSCATTPITPIVYVLNVFDMFFQQEAASYAPIIAGLLGCGVKKLEETAAARQRPRRLLCIIVAGWDRRETQCSAKDADYKID